MPKPDKNKKNAQKENKRKNHETDELELLKKENEYLRIELEYLKKLKARGLKDPRANNKQ